MQHCARYEQGIRGGRVQPIAGIVLPISQSRRSGVSSEVVRYEVDSGTITEIEIEPVAGFQPASSGDVAGRVREAAKPAIQAARELLDQVRVLTPDAVQVKFGVKVTGTTNWLIAKAATEGNFEVTLHWQPQASPADGSTFDS
ncbi:CU044_2847 family protein [Micromonospora profundi]|uniref:CU044_2847 family protein n=1 Tax=Micromonospora TaxID=1873 RepID=UPI0033B56B48